MCLIRGGKRGNILQLTHPLQMVSEKEYIDFTTIPYKGGRREECFTLANPYKEGQNIYSAKKYEQERVHLVNSCDNGKYTIIYKSYFYFLFYHYRNIYILN